jgi:SAM-dependent methyltransferase
MHQNSWLLFEKYALPIFNEGCSVLEIGPDGKPSTYQKLVGSRSGDWDTVEISNSQLNTTYLATTLYEYPIEDNRYDIVLSGQVIEHVPNLWRWMKEISRICKPGGTVITINPVTWFYHEAPVDCWRIYPEGMKALSEDAGLEVIVSTWESVEIDRLARWLPESVRQRKVRLQRFALVFDLIGRALRSNFRGSFDTITLARKL